MTASLVHFPGLDPDWRTNSPVFVPNVLLDWVMPVLSGSEFRVATYLAGQLGRGGDPRRQIAISIADVQRGTGLCLSTTKRALSVLKRRRVVTATPQLNEFGGYASTLYGWDFEGMAQFEYLDNEPPTPRRGCQRPKMDSAKRWRIIARIVARDGALCGLCGKPVDLDRVHVEHDLPLSLDGDSSLHNLQLAHGIGCNLRKGARLVPRTLPPTTTQGT